MTFPVNKRQWLAHYRKTVEALERIRALELKSMTDEEAMRKIQSLQCAGTPWRERPYWSGLVEQQALFHRPKRKK